MADSTFRAIYSLSGGVPWSLSYTITASEAWSVGSVLTIAAAGTLTEAGDDSTDVAGISNEVVTAGASTGPITTLCSFTPFIYGVVYAVKEAAGLTNTPLVTDIGNDRDLDLDGTNGWGIHVSSGGTTDTPTFLVVDIDTIRDEWHVVIAPQATSEAVWQLVNVGVA